MTNEQFYILIAVPSAISLVGMLANVLLISRLNTALNGRLSSVETRVSLLEARIVDFEGAFNSRCDSVMRRLLELRHEL